MEYSTLIPIMFYFPIPKQNIPHLFHGPIAAERRSTAHETVSAINGIFYTNSMELLRNIPVWNIPRKFHGISVEYSTREYSS